MYQFSTLDYLSFELTPEQRADLAVVDLFKAKVKRYQEASCAITSVENPDYSKDPLILGYYCYNHQIALNSSGICKGARRSLFDSLTSSMLVTVKRSIVDCRKINSDLKASGIEDGIWGIDLTELLDRGNAAND